MPEPLSYLDRSISLAALSFIELAPSEMVTAVSLAGYRYISLRLLRRRALEATRTLLKRLDDEDRAAAGTWPQPRSSVRGGICCPNSGDTSSASLL